MNTTNMRLQLQTLLDDKEKQLQLTGTLGQRFLQQQMELEERINQLSEYENAHLKGARVDEANSEMRVKLQELAETMQHWEVENEQIWSGFGSKQLTSAPPSARPIQTPITPGSSPRGPQRDLPPPQAPEDTSTTSAGPSAAQSSRRAKNAAHRANDVEFAFEIGSSLLTEVRRLQALLSERDKSVHDLKEERDDLDKTVDSLRTTLRQQEASADKFKEENWNLEVTSQELRNQLADAQAAAARAEADFKRTMKQLTSAREVAESHKIETEKLVQSLDDLKGKHETDVAQMRKQAASLSRDKSDLQSTLDTLKSDIAKKEKAFKSFPSPMSAGAITEFSTPVNGDREDELLFTGPAASRRKDGPGSAFLTPGGAGHEYRTDYDDSPEPSPTKPKIVLGPSHPTNELETLKQSLAHAHRHINTLKGSIQREKEQKLMYKRQLAKDGTPGHVPGAWGDEDEDEDEAEDVLEEEPIKPARRTPHRLARGRGSGRGGRGGARLTLAQKLGIAAAERERGEWEEEEYDLPNSSTIRDLRQETLDDEPSPFIVPSAPPSRPTSTGSLDPAFANVLRDLPSTNDPYSSLHGSSPLKSLPIEPVEPSPSTKKSRGGAGFQDAARPLSLIGSTSVPTSLGAEFSGFGGMNDQSHMLLEELEVERPELKEMGVQADPEPVPVPEPVIKEVIREVIVEVPVEKIVERIVEVPVEKIVEVERIVNVNVDRPVEVEKIVERIVEVPFNVDKLVEVPVEKIVEKIVEVPVEKIVEVERIVNVNVDRPVEVEKIVERIVEVPVDRIVEKIVEVPVDRIVEVPVDRIVERIVEVPVEVEKIVERIVEVPVEKIVERIVEVPASIPIPPPKSYSSADIQTDEIEQPVPPSAVSREVEIQTTPMLNLEIQSMIIDREEIEIPISSASATSLSRLSFPASIGDDGDISFPAPRTPRITSMASQRSPRPVAMIFEDPDDGDSSGLENENETETEAEYTDAREALGLTPTPSQSISDFHSAAGSIHQTDAETPDSDADSIITSRNGVRQSYNSLSTHHGRRVSQMSNATSRPHSALHPIAAPVQTKPEVKEASIQTDEWTPPAPPVAIAPSTPIFHRVATTSSASAPPFQFISSPARDNTFNTSTASITPTNIRSTSPPVISKTPFRDSASTFGGSKPRVQTPGHNRGDRRQSIESAFSQGVMNVGGGDENSRMSPPRMLPPPPVDKTRPPTMMMPPPPPMPPPATLPVKKVLPPPRPTSPPPIELIQRATTPTFGRSVTPVGGQSLMVPPGGRGYVRVHGSSVPPSSNGSQNLRQPSSTSSFRSAPNGPNSYNHSQRSPIIPGFPEHGGTLNNRRAENLSSTPSLLLSGGSSQAPSRRPSVSSSRSSEIHTMPPPNMRTPARNSISRNTMNAPTTPGRGLDDSGTDPDVIHAITQTMIGEYLYKYTRRVVGKGYGEKRHKRFFWVHPYTKTLYWSDADPGSSSVGESSAKSAYIDSVKSVLDPNPNPPGIYQYSVVVSTPNREMKFTCPTKERHDIWFNALKYLLARPITAPSESPSHVDENVEPSRSPSAHRKYSTDRIGREGARSPSRPRSIHSIHSFSVTPRAMRNQSQTQLSHSSSLGKRPGTPAAEYLRWADEAQSPTKSIRRFRPDEQPEQEDYENAEGAEETFELAEAEQFEGLENVRACCDGAHDLGTLSRRPGHHHHHSHTQQSSQVDPPPPSERPISPSGWSFRSRAGSTHSESGGGLFGWGGTGDGKRSLRFKRQKSPGPGLSTLPVPRGNR